MSKRKPKWTRPRPVRDDRCGSCGWRRADGHNPSCATRWAALTSAEQIAETRAALMTWIDVQRQMREWNVDVDAIAAAAARGISARAAELGLEHDEAWDR